MDIWYYTAATLNGFLTDENFSLDWLFNVPHTVGDLESFQKSIGVIVCGSHTYEWVISQENILQEPEKWSVFYGNTPVVIFSSRQPPIPDGANIHRINLPIIQSLDYLYILAKNKDIWVQGGGDLAGQFFDAKVLTKIGITYICASVQYGAPLLPRTINPRQLELLDIAYNDKSFHCNFALHNE